MTANTKISHEDLGYLGENAQYQIVKGIIEDSEFYLSISNYLKETAFVDQQLQKFVKIITSYYKETGNIPTYKELEVILKDRTTNKEELTALHEVFNKVKEANSNGIKVTLEVAKKFFQTQELKRILKSKFEKTGRNGYSSELLNEVLEELAEIEYGTRINESTDLMDLMDEVLDGEDTTKVPTGIKELDAKMNGGLEKGTLGMLIAGTGVGKSTLGSIICCEAAVHGFKVLHIFFEDLNREIGQKYYAHLTGIKTDEFSKGNNRELLKSKIFNSVPNAKQILKNNIKLLRLENSETTIPDLKNEVAKIMKIYNWKPDMIFIDYLSCLKLSSNEAIRMQNEWQSMDRAVKRLDAFAKEQNIAIWIAQQTNRDGGKLEDTSTRNKRLATIQGSYRAIQPATRVLYLERDENTGDINRANLYLDKARNATTAEWKGVYFNNATCQIRLDDLIADDSEEVINSFDSRAKELTENKLKLINNNGKDIK